MDKNPCLEIVIDSGTGTGDGNGRGTAIIIRDIFALVYEGFVNAE